MDGAAHGAVVHLLAEFTGVSPAALRDAALLGGVLIAAVGAAGLHTVARPVLRVDDTRGADALLLLEGGHAALHAYVPQQMLLVDLLGPEPAQLATALEVLTRRLKPVAVSAERLVRLGRPA